ncbi:MAG: AAA family ATPase [Solirubrobacterales bacterium]|nr:AAA family ATPase [Solirubrobacterales bacterium]MCB8970402.1 AAA family ATPase [Thermoleophilales bacterium]MCO5325563.1 AAA family ATPase [Solirubrobacterales bacterium]
MHLKSITLKGFKSFPERTQLEFSPGVSVIVGPNGCGKSNITDGVLWALGEQSPLAVRGQSMQDVIFAGGRERSARSAAEVEVVIDNSDGAAGSEFSEISVTRSLDRAGDGGYRLNGARCRLSDVSDALSDASLGREMHSVIGQGKVEAIVLSKPRERRLLIEEAAGLGKHRKRRRRAQLKLERTRQNLDRALDVEREARSRLRPLRAQANAAETHARLERQSMELKLQLLGDRLSVGDGDLAVAEKAALEARAERDRVESLVEEARKRRSAVEDRLAERDRERTAVWADLTALRAAHERLGARTEAIATREAELRAAVERRRAALGALAAELRATERDAEATLARELESAREALADASGGIADAIDAGDVEERLGALARVRNGAERAVRSARRAEDMLGHRRQDSLEQRVEAEADLATTLATLCAALAQARDAVGLRASRVEEQVVGARAGDELASELRDCSRAEAELQGELRTISERVTSAEVGAAQLRDRREEAEAEWARIIAKLAPEEGESPEPARLEEDERVRIEAAIERLIRRREQLGPVNPLAEGEYQQAKEHVADLEAQREDLEKALDELQKLIRQTDREITAAFEETFEAAQRNFEELIEHMFPGGSGRLRLVEEQRPKRVLGGADPEDARTGSDAAAAFREAEEAGEARSGSGGEAGGEPRAAAEETDPDADPGADPDAEADGSADSAGVEIEVTPAGKATRRLSLLSGGEKSLVALAFVFSVFLARPSPFYILDEVEAALDDANIDRFLQLVRRFSDRAQFVIVTHQKRTMDAADVLYGVSMQDGATKVISRRLPREQQLGQADLGSDDVADGEEADDSTAAA